MLWLVLLCSFLIIHAQYEVPDATVEVFSRGFSVSIPDDEVIKLFAFHGKINEEIINREAGTFSQDVLKPVNGRWTFSDSITKLKVGDVLYYWTYVILTDGRGYAKDDQMFEVKEITQRPTTPPRVTPTTPPRVTPTPVTSKPTVPVDSCGPTETTTNDQGSCKGRLIFEEQFQSQLRDQLWRVEQKFASSPDYEFVIYENRPEILRIENEKLKITPIVAEDLHGTGFVTNTYDLGERCTGVIGSAECKQKPDGGFYLPPVISSQVTTKQKFSFKYGKIEFRAKLPQGDWIYPELYLNSVNDNYGPNYDSGQIRIAFTSGNADSNKILHGGLILGSTTAARSYGMKTIEKHTSWCDEFHRFAVNWKPGSISVSVDDKVYGNIYPPENGFASLGTTLQIQNSDRWKMGTTLAPFDKEMYITIGVGVGGFNFEDRSDGSKPWKNGERLSMKKFYNAQSQWRTTWNENSTLEVDYVKVWAL